ncbi:glycolate oxidase iron-sulfur subunit [Marinobacterium aestuarii]|uniref:Glycolate oxidase iron-sulfur subunit n=1 Tax=Marinobacterium aestuarii TaxID=1821621 RepID=A0A1A9EZV6_9GAMM|nr:glycolate oxidase subunit GlcF [Marinobacterium aestuarii]ANG63191.1 glycolate oxidase iron-sulfur subunit [Marinobacterium aestuarii]
MKTNILPEFKQSARGQEAESILRSCVHCGFCTATCPTYQELNDERDGPRGRIYLIKQLLEEGTVTEKTRTHLDRCLTCRSCETTCPSGVQYGRLVDIGRAIVDEKLERPPAQRLLRWSLRQVLPYPARFGPLLRLGQSLKPLLPAVLKAKLPPKRRSSPWPVSSHPRVMLALAGCAQPAAAPNTNAATARVLDRLGISLVEAPKAGCCGAVSYHLSAHDEGLDFMRRNIDAWWPAIEAGAEAIVMTASGCGAMVQEYGHLLRQDKAYADKARRVSELTRDLGEVLLQEDLSVLAPNPAATGKVAFHCPCTLQHAMKQSGVVEQVLEKAGVELAKTKDKHLCCGSAGTYSILQPEMSQKLLRNKLDALTLDNPERIVTANIGCQLHLESKSDRPVQHWIELLDR